MDSHQFDDLQENDLYRFLTNFKHWWARYGTMSLYILVAVLLVITVIRVISVKRAAEHEQNWSSLAQATSPEAYRQVANDPTATPSVRALALLRGADLLLNRAVLPADAAQPEAATGAETSAAAAAVTNPEEDLQAAQLMYQRVLDDAEVHDIYQLNAHMGLANVAEVQKNWDQARQQWQTVYDGAAEYPQMREQARQRLAMISELQRPVVFAPETAAEPAAGATMIQPGMGQGMPRLTDEPAPATPATDAAAEPTAPAAADRPAPAAADDQPESAAPQDQPAPDAPAPAAQ